MVGKGRNWQYSDHFTMEHCNVKRGEWFEKKYLEISI